jgi:hypothetical protein
LDFVHHPVLNNTIFRKLDLPPSPGEGGDTCSVGSVARNSTERLPLHLRTETDPVCEMLCSPALFRIPDDGQSPELSNSDLESTKKDYMRAGC